LARFLAAGTGVSLVLSRVGEKPGLAVALLHPGFVSLVFLPRQMHANW